MGEPSELKRPDPESLARTHLANERTFLAWLRTGTGMVALGLGAAQFLTRDVVPGLPVVRMLALTLVAGGVLIALGSAWRYTKNLRRIDQRAFRPAHHSVTLSTAAVAVVGCLALVFIAILRG